MSQSAPRQPPLSPDDMLPPVEPPSGGFIVQLFFVPLIIVLVIVAVYLMFTWLAHMGRDPDEYVKRIGDNDAGSMQAAMDLATDLRGQPELQSDAGLARQLAALLERELAEGGLETEDLALRVFLCKALGEFRVPDGWPALVAAAEQNRDDKELVVRTAAVQAIALLVDHCRVAAPPESASASAREPTASLAASVLPALLAAADDDSDLLRSSAAYALGVVGGEAALDKLAVMQDSAYPDVRYNAATGLARQGDERAVRILAEMLDPAELRVDTEQAARQEGKRAVIVINALEATRQLSQANAEADLDELRQAVEALVAADLSPPVRVKAEETARALAERAAPAAAQN